MIWVSIIFFFSGLSALVYQLLWMRHLGFIFGNTVYAGATVLTAFMTGLAIGSHIFGRFAERIKNPLKCFALLEWGIAIYALSLPFLFSALSLIYRYAYRAMSDNLLFLTPLRFILAFLLLLIPTILMGGTLPVLIRGFACQNRRFGARLAWLYGINTLGAVAGILISGFYLLPVLGITNTNILAVATDLLAGIGAWGLAHGNKTSQPIAEPRRPSFHFREMPFSSRYAIMICTLCGFTALALEVIWFRALILVLGSTTYSFTIMLGVFLLGMSIGSLLVAPFLDRLNALLPLLATFVVLIGTCTLCSLYFFDQSPDFLLAYLRDHKLSWQSMNQARFLISSAHLILPALFSGAAFSTAARIVRRDEPSSSGVVGIVYALNTLGAMAGSFAGGFLLLPNLGIQGSLSFLSLIMLGAGLSSLAVQGRRIAVRLCAILVTVSLTAFVAINPPDWNKAILASGAFFSPFNFIRNGKITLRETIMNDRMLYYEEALCSTVSVHRSIDEQKYFCVDGKTEADQHPRGMMVQRLIGHLPMLFHSNPKSVINVGLGAGVSFGALGCYPVDRLEVVEIEPATQRAAITWRDLNHNILANPRANVIINDGRNHLFATTNQYDVITADPFEPVVGGASHLFTVNYFRLGRERLSSNGIMCQWVPMYEMSSEDYLMIVRSFVTVFPNTALFYTGFDTLLLGFRDTMQLDPKLLRTKFEIETVRNSLAEIGITSPEMILGMFVADLSQNPDFCGQGRLNTDDRPFIEFSVPKKALEYTTDANQAALLRVFTEIPKSWLMNLDAAVASRLNSEHEAVRLMLKSGVLRENGETEKSFNNLLEAHTIAPDNQVVKNELVDMLQSSATALRKSGHRDEAAKQYQIALKLNPHHFWSLYNLVELGMLAGKQDFAQKILARATVTYPDSPMIIALQGKFIFSQGRHDEGLNLIERATRMHPNSLRLFEDLEKLSKLSGETKQYQYARENITRIESFIGTH